MTGIYTSHSKHKTLTVVASLTVFTMTSYVQLLLATSTEQQICSYPVPFATCTCSRVACTRPKNIIRTVFGHGLRSVSPKNAINAPAPCLRLPSLGHRHIKRITIAVTPKSAHVRLSKPFLAAALAWGEKRAVERWFSPLFVARSSDKDDRVEPWWPFWPRNLDPVAPRKKAKQSLTLNHCKGNSHFKSPNKLLETYQQRFCPENTKVNTRQALNNF